MVDIVCDGPGPHIPASGIIGESDIAVTGMRCSAAPCNPSLTPASIAAAAIVANQATIQANITAHIATIETWLTANPNGGILTAAQTKVLAQMLVGIGRVLLGLTSTVGQAN